MSDISVTQMTRAQVKASIDKWKTSWKDSRDELLRMFEGGAHKAYGCKDFTEFALEHLGINVTDRTIQNHLTAARVERGLTQSQSRPDEIISSGEKSLPLLAALEINRLPKEKWDRVYEEYMLRDEHGTRTPGALLTELKRIVKRELGPKEKTATPTPTPTKSKNDMRPIVPPTYDGTPEQEEAERNRQLSEADAIIQAQETAKAAQDLRDNADSDEDESPAKMDALKQTALATKSVAVVVGEPDDTQIVIDAYQKLLSDFNTAVCLLRAWQGSYMSNDPGGTLEANADTTKFLKEFPR